MPVKRKKDKNVWTKEEALADKIRRGLIPAHYQAFEIDGRLYYGTPEMINQQVADGQLFKIRDTDGGAYLTAKEFARWDKDSPF